MTRLVMFAVMGLAAAGAALGHQGVTNPVVMARMNVMSGVADQTKVLGQMVKGAAEFDAAQAAAAREALIAHARAVPEAFAKPETDPKSEALPAIWDQPEKFAAANDAFIAAAEGLDVSSAQALAASFGALGASCSGCHRDYRLKR